MHVFRERLSICVCFSFPFGFAGGILDFIMLVPSRNGMLSLELFVEPHTRKGAA